MVTIGGWQLVGGSWLVPTTCHNHLPPTNFHQPIPTNCHPPIATNQLPPTNCHQLIVGNWLVAIGGEEEAGRRSGYHTKNKKAHVNVVKKELGCLGCPNHSS